ncbi:malonate decarboxylase acyl carrier protein [Rhodobacteraceae bacterium RKSG542]|uniref:malonate decarboxylase acyl carrier protein n=1 Tax=Pseudovibrio flavus TaxID=2529854 RepID=UPI0012BBD451|nr:malonate decarboxylase acyl carrier protein [Pseudovibrio flavus]MTI16849.1 malonate decarboxylase acyl carrier protein [Pseudovibrio flavus]
MALNQLNFSIENASPTVALGEAFHLGVVGSGDLEMIIESKEQGGAVSFQILSPVTGFDDLWKRVADAFVRESGLGNAHIEINDNNATPAVVMLRLRQALAEATAR